MHFLIKLMVEGDNAKEALENAEAYAGALCGHDDSGYSDFDWFDMDGRWGTSKAHKIGSVKGRELIASAMKSSRDEFDSAMAHIRYMVEHFNDDDIYEENLGTREEQAEIRNQHDKIYYLSRYQFSIAGGSSSNSCYLYNESWGGRVTNQKDLDYILKDDNKLWVVPVDFHN